jgi:DNA-binding GntR family transcriptional regulator
MNPSESPADVGTQNQIQLVPGSQRPISMVEHIYATLKRQILTCVLAPGLRLNEKELCNQFSISRTPLREALNRLRGDSLVELGHYRGYVVASIVIADVIELCEVRAILEGSVCELAAERASKEEIEYLTTLAELPYKPGDRSTYESYLEANIVFHRALSRTARNGHLENTVMAVLDQLQRPLYLGLDKGIDPLAARNEHIEFVDAIRSHDGALASRLMKWRIGQAKQRMIEVMRQSGFA